MPPYDYEKSEWAQRLDEMRRADRAKRDAENAALYRDLWERGEQRRQEKPAPAPHTATCPVCSGHGHIAITTDAPDHA